MSLEGIDRWGIGVLLIDVQPLFWDLAFGAEGELAAAARESLLVRMEHLLMLADWMELPTLATSEHPVEQNGQLPERPKAVFPARGQRFTKRTYNCGLEPTIREAIKRLPVQQFAVAGAETDVCILQSVLGLLRMGCSVFLLEDCLFTWEPHPGPALQRIYQAGAMPCTFESFAYELAETVDHTPWSETWFERNSEYAKPFPEAFGPLEGIQSWPAGPAGGTPLLA